MLELFRDRTEAVHRVRKLDGISDEHLGSLKAVSLKTTTSRGRGTDYR